MFGSADVANPPRIERLPTATFSNPRMHGETRPIALQASVNHKAAMALPLRLVGRQNVGPVASGKYLPQDPECSAQLQLRLTAIAAAESKLTYSVLDDVCEYWLALRSNQRTAVRLSAD